ncbi:hypothetical protein [Rhizobium binxianense]|uniref:hypothetical protein n=1 Tax=Rhizobium binxianense TaxID=3024242 RepID=UPI00234F57B8|nr:hypothetical protein [Rhizobium sp. BC56]MDC7741240.1 hypothetical protein [Rhizobium sp. BC56]
MNDNHKDREEDEDGGEDGGGLGSGAGMALTPPSGRKSSARLTEEADEEDDHEPSGVLPDGDDYPRSADDLDNQDDLPNEMIIGTYNGQWYLFDTDGTRYGPFRDREKAVEVAFSIRSWGPTP